MEKLEPWHSSITEVHQDDLWTHGVNQSEIIREFSYEEMVFFLLKGKRPTPTQRNLLRAVIVSHISHGITGQSTMAVIQAADCRSDFLHAAIGEFSVGAGIYHQGGLRAAMLELQNFAVMAPSVRATCITERLGAREKIIGFGHRFHSRDPRARILLEIAEEEGFTGPYLIAAKEVKTILRDKKGIFMNIEAAGGAILLDLGFDPAIAHLIIITGRSPMYAAAYLERLAQERVPFQKLAVADVLEK
ncbi:citrate/2-methylcitrate synthase [Dictyobacter arantiisoli]|uniref:citrate synthase (unknown stereospecificity) n=1 Tax=Dictyobacter arantiisoli TaxID=2014874 RepID=A0A5A5TKU5_9CHLR|nr:citrate/2-methylcitrate synthase [Dictyobacter arantiisoli]GCF11915.1 citryl-CoA lyase [Dictyobacter arantiisoli]